MPPVIALVGPTGVGKTAISIPLAKWLNAEIISADSRQIYRHMDIVTAKPSSVELREVRHHFVGFLDPAETYSAGRFGEEGRERISQIEAAGKRVLVVGGSGLYIKALLDGFFEGVVRDESFREAFRLRVDREGTLGAFEELQRIDPVAGQRISPNDIKRIERALEVYHVSGRTLTELHRDSSHKLDYRVIGLTYPREQLYQRIESRVDAMLKDDAAVFETKRLLEMGYSTSLTSMEGIGYRDIIRYISGLISEDEMVKRFKQDTRNYAKRQLTWFRKVETIDWVDATGGNPHQLAREIQAKLA